MIYPLVRELAAAGAPLRVPVAVTCRALKIAKQPYYRWLKDPVSQRDWDDAHLIDAARDAYREDPAFGYRLIADELADLGFDASERRVWRLCSQNGIVSAISRRKRGKGTKPGPPVHDDRVRRNFTADAPDRLWLTDITEHWTIEGRLYFVLELRLPIVTWIAQTYHRRRRQRALGRLTPIEFEAMGCGV